MDYILKILGEKRMSINVLAVSTKKRKQQTKQTTLTPKLVWIMLLFKKAFGYLAEP